MKIFVLVITAIACMSMVSCANNSVERAEQVEVVEDTSFVVEEAVDDAPVCDSVAAEELPPDSITGD